MIKTECKFEPNQKAFDAVNNFPDKVIGSIARITLDYSVPVIPKDKGNLRSSSVAYGAKKIGDAHYAIRSGGNGVDYATYVWVMDPATTNWTTPGTTSKWYVETLKKKGKSIILNSVERNKLK